MISTFYLLKRFVAFEPLVAFHFVWRQTFAQKFSRSFFANVSATCKLFITVFFFFNFTSSFKYLHTFTHITLTKLCSSSVSFQLVCLIHLCFLLLHAPPFIYLGLMFFVHVNYALNKPVILRNLITKNLCIFVINAKMMIYLFMACCCKKSGIIALGRNDWHSSDNNGGKKVVLKLLNWLNSNWMAWVLNCLWGSVCMSNFEKS